MTDAPYSNREIEHFFKELNEKLDSQDKKQEERHNAQDKKLSEIEAQTRKTNGRVNKLEVTAIALGALLVGLGVSEGYRLVALFI